MTESEKNEIIKEVFAVLNQYGKTIENLTSITEVAADDLIEVSGGRRIRIGDLLKDVSTIEELKKLFVSKVDSDTADGYIKFPAGISVKGVDISDSLSLWKKKQDPDGNPYLYTDLPIVTRSGLITYNDDGTINLPDLYAGLPLDGTTIGRDASGALTVLGGVGSDFDAAQMWATLSGSGAEQINKSHLTDALAGYARTSDIPSLSGYATESWVTNKGYVTTTRLNELIGGASSAFDTLKEIEDYINSHESVTAGLIASLGNKVDKVTGMGLSEHSFTTAMREKLNSIAEGANKYILPVAKAAVLGGVMIGSNINVNAQGVISVAAPYSHPTQQVITAGAARHFLTGLAVNEYGHVTSATSAALTKDDLLSVLKDKDGVIRLDAQLALTGSLINFANLGTVNIPSLYDGIPVDGKSIYWENGTLKSSSTGGGGLAKVIVKVGLAAYESVDGVVTLPAYPTMPDLTNYVTLNTSQVITGQKTFTSPIYLNNSVIGDNAESVNLYTKEFGGQGLNIRSLLISGTYTDRQYVPDQGLWAAGPLKANSFVKHGGTHSQLLRATGGVIDFDYTGQNGQPYWLWGTNDGNNSKVYNPANFRVANANTVGDVGLNRILAYKGTLVSNVNFDNLWEPACYFNQIGNGTNNSNHQLTYSVDLVFGGDAYISQLQHGANNSSLAIRQRWDGVWSPWKTIPFENGNIESANRLRHARSIWGQSYDGTGDVDGNFSTSGDIYSSGVIKTSLMQMNGQDFVIRGKRALVGDTSRLYINYANDFAFTEIVGPLTVSGNIDVTGNSHFNQKVIVDRNRFSSSASPSISLAIGDTDTGFDWANDGVYKIKSNGGDVAQVSPDRFHFYKKLVIESNEGNYCEGIRIKASSSNWVTIALGAIGEAGTSENMWSIHRTYENNFAIARNDSSGVNGMFIGKNGNVGFGTVTPTCKMEIHGAIKAVNGVITTNTEVYAGDAIYSGGRIFTGYDAGVVGAISCSNWFRSNGATGWFNGTYNGGIYMADSDQVRVYNNKVLYNDGFRQWGIGGHHCGIKLYNQDHIGINLATASYTWGIYANTDGNIYIGRRDGDINNTTGSYYLIIGAGTMTYNGSIVLNGGGLITYSSDIRLKEIQEYFKPSLSELAALPIFAHSWRNGTPGVQLSTSAQAVQKIMPWNVFEGSDGYLKMDGTRTALAVSIRLAQLANEYITENDRWKSDKDRQIEELQREVKELKQQLNVA